MTESTRNIIRAIKAACPALQAGYEEGEIGEAKDALDDLNRALHAPDIDPDVAALATEFLELGYAMND